MAPFFMLKEFVDYLYFEKRYTEHTVIAYQKDIEQFLEFSEITEVVDLQNTTPSQIRGWTVSLIESNLVNTSVNRKLSALRSFFKWLRKEHGFVANPFQKIRGPKNAKRLPSFAKESELESASIQDLFTSDFSGLRNALMFEMFYQTGIRLNELIHLKESDVQNNTIRVTGKRNKERIIPFSIDLFTRIQNYLLAKRSNEIHSEYLFTLDNGKKLYPKFVYRKINLYLRAATNLDKCSPHVLRHTFATHMLNNGAGLEVLKDILGHANLSATQVYTHNSFAQLTHIYSQAHPRGHKLD
jgi:integrase/recombinase XerC